MGFIDVHASDLAEIRDDLDGANRATLVWSGQSVTGSASDATQEDREDLAGFGVDADLEWTGLVADFTSSTPPGRHANLTVDGDDYVVVRRQDSADGVGFKLVLRRKA